MGALGSRRPWSGPYGSWGSWSGAGVPIPAAPCQLPLSLCKKVLVIMHDSILPHLAQPSLMIDFLTRAYDMGEC